MNEPVRITVSRDFPFPPERVFDAWLDPRIAKKFLFATETGEMVRVEIDASVGGTYTFVDRRDGEDVEHIGEYVEIERPRRLVFTSAVPKYSPEFDRIEVDIVPTASGCRLTLTNVMSAQHAAEWGEQTREGWTMILGNLEQALG